jgi:Methyltransferase FkbM domain
MKPQKLKKVNAVKLDDFEEQIDFTRIEFIKIDVEGFEMEVLRGMRRLLESRKPALMIEIEPRHNPKYLEVFKFFHVSSYKPYMTVDGVKLRPLNTEEIPTLQSNERLAMDGYGSRTFRRGQQKFYINNFFFLQPSHNFQFKIADARSAN